MLFSKLFSILFSIMFLVTCGCFFVTMGKPFTGMNMVLGIDIFLLLGWGFSYLVEGCPD